MKNFNNIKSILFGSMLLLAGGSSLTSCTDWLDKDPEAIIAEDEAFKNFRNFQGFIEEIYNMVPNITNANYCSGWNMGDDAVHNTEGYSHIDHQVDLGNYRTIWDTGNMQCWLNGSRCSLWSSSWKCIRKCNLGIANIKSMVGTDEQRDLLLGQMYFFRAWWHFELMMFWGGMPYIDEAYESTAIPEKPRLSFQECADRCAEDFKKAYDLLPMDWDRTIAGMETSDNKGNALRVNKFMALCYLGKCYLWAASPLMKEFEKWNKGGNPELLNASKNGKTYDYDEKYCALASEALGKALDMVNKGSVPYRLATFDYSNIYDHMFGEEVGEYSQQWYTYKQQWKMPGVDEAIFRGVCPATNTGPWNHLKLFGPKVAGIVDHDNIIHHPTANLIDQYGMANGQPIYLVENGQLVLNPKSGWDPEHPYKNRDPRFYHDIVFDGFHYVLNTEGLTEEQKKCEYCSLYTNGLMRNPQNGSSTGYFIQKLSPHQCNRGDGTNASDWYEWNGAMQAYIPYMRLADVYLMYAEARAGMAKTATDLNSKPDYCPNVSAIDAVNKLRRRVNTGDWPMEDVQPEYKDSKEHFLDEIRRERAVELAFEGFRWNDLQRWLLLTEPPYTVKYSHEFERLEKDSWFTNHDPKDAKVGNFHNVELISRNLKEKHYWFPLPDKDTYLYEGFPQNLGW